MAATPASHESPNARFASYAICAAIRIRRWPLKKPVPLRVDAANRDRPDLLPFPVRAAASRRAERVASRHKDREKRRLCTPPRHNATSRRLHPCAPRPARRKRSAIVRIVDPRGRTVRRAAVQAEGLGAAPARGSASARSHMPQVSRRSRSRQDGEAWFCSVWYPLTLTPESDLILRQAQDDALMVSLSNHEGRRHQPLVRGYSNHCAARA